MRSLSRVRLATAAATLLFLTGCGGAAASSHGSPGATSKAGMEGDAASEVCSRETRTNVANQLTVGTIAGIPAMTRVGTRTTCSYHLSTGSMRMVVDELASNSAAKERFTTLQRLPGDPTAVPNLGAAAFTRSDGTTITVKDNKVLTVDTTSLPAGNDKTQISQSLSFEILSCWTG